MTAGDEGIKLRPDTYAAMAELTPRAADTFEGIKGAGAEVANDPARASKQMSSYTPVHSASSLYARPVCTFDKDGS
jgi:hypothetical protein